MFKWFSFVYKLLLWRRGSCPHVIVCMSWALPYIRGQGVRRKKVPSHKLKFCNKGCDFLVEKAPV